jgi:hypothetical protein
MKSTKKKSNLQNQKSSWSFASKSLSLYGGLLPIMEFVKRIGLSDQLEHSFTTKKQNARKFKLSQLFLSVIFASLGGVYRLTSIAVFTCDPLVQKILQLSKGLNKDVISVEFKKLGQCGARILEDIFGYRIKGLLKASERVELTLDADSTIKTVYGNQEGAGKGYNPEKKGANSYHPMLLFATERKLLVHSWFRTGTAYTSNGIVEFLKQAKEYIPAEIKILFRADSGFFNGALFDYLEVLCWEYLVKVKFKGLVELLKKQQWLLVPGLNDQWTCEFEYKGIVWKKSRVLKAVRGIKKYERREEFGAIVLVPVYEYAVYCSTLNLDAWSTHKKYVERAVCETWIEQVKSQLYAATTLTDDFWANDILWQLAAYAYNLSLHVRIGAPLIYKQEHRTFREWFIGIAAEVSSHSKALEIRLYKQYFFRTQWEAFVSGLNC